MANTTYLIPKRGLNIRDPQTLTPLPKEGAKVVLNAHWQRRIEAGDVRIGEPPADEPATATPAAGSSATDKTADKPAGSNAR